MNNTNIQLKGLGKLFMNLNLVTAKLSGDLEKLAWNAGRIVETRAKEIITEKEHIITGNLRRSIDTKKPVEATPYVFRVAIGTDVFYAVFVENLPDGGYLFRALFETKELAYEYIKRGLTGALL